MSIEGWWVEPVVVILTAVLTTVSILIRGYLKKISDKMLKTEIEEEAFEALMAGVTEVENDFVREVKKASKDGKLSKEEIERAEKLAIAAARDMAEGPAKTLLLNVSERYLRSWIKEILPKIDREKSSEVVNGTNS